MDKKIGLVLEGGGFRGVFTEGILECLLENDINLPYVIGVSMGSANGANYVAKQKRRNYDIAMTYLNDDRYISIKNMVTKGGLFGMDFVFNDIAYELDPFDFKAFYDSKQELVIGAMSCYSGLTDYFYKSDLEERDLLKALQASCSLPFISKKVSIKGVEYLDGGVSDSIPVRKALEDSCEKVIIILTRDKDYIKEPFTKSQLGKIIYYNNPVVVKMMEKRHIYYKETMDYIKELEESGVALVLRPPKPIEVGRTEKNHEKVRTTFLMGYNYGKESMDTIQAFIKNDNSE